MNHVLLCTQGYRALSAPKACKACILPCSHAMHTVARRPTAGFKPLNGGLPCVPWHTAATERAYRTYPFFPNYILTQPEITYPEGPGLAMPIRMLMVLEAIPGPHG